MKRIRAVAILIKNYAPLLPFKILIHYANYISNPLSEIQPNLETVFLHEYETKVIYQ